MPDQLKSIIMRFATVRNPQTATQIQNRLGLIGDKDALADADNNLSRLSCFFGKQRLK